MARLLRLHEINIRKSNESGCFLIANVQHRTDHLILRFNHLQVGTVPILGNNGAHDLLGQFDIVLLISE
jgi:hypothetical protein